MNNPFSWLFSSSGFMPHGFCYLWQPSTLWLNVGSDGLIAAAYYAIPFTLYYLVRERRAELPYPGLLLMFAAFIFLCGTTHIMEIWTVWNPAYRIEGAVKLLTAMASIATTLALFRVIPQAMLLQSPEQLRREVEARTAELAHVNAMLREEIAARDLAQFRLREQDRRKDEFLATLAHELRNPLAPIRHAAKLLTSGAVEPPQLAWSGEVIARQARRMALLLDDLLDVSRITRGRLELKKDRVSLVALINAAVDTVRPTMEEKRQTLTVTLPDESLTIEVDPLRLSQAISNLLTNAAKFTPPDGSVWLLVSRTPERLLITVRDSGMGFDPEQAAELFEMFSQAHDHGEISEGGLGIGLALVKGLIELHGGSVDACSSGKGGGAEFVLELPASVIVSSAPAPSSAPPATSSPPDPVSVLLVDDNRDAAQTMAMLLELWGHEVLVAHSAREAIDVSERSRPHVAILDIGLPDMNGYELARHIRRQPWGETALLIAMTGWGQSEDKERARLAGFDRHFTKPVDPDAVEAVLQAYAAPQGPPAGVPQ